MFILLIVVHVIVCLFLIGVVLLQSGKAADLAGAFGGMGSQTAFGPRGSATVLSKATTIAAGLFMVTSMGLSILATRNQGGATTVLDQAAKTETKKAAAPAAKGPAQPTNVPSVTVGDQTLPLPKPGEPGAIVVQPGESQESIAKKAQAELERLEKAAQEKAAAKAAAKKAAAGQAPAPAEPGKK